MTAELVEVATGDRLWSQAYDGEEKDVLSIQEEIARAVVNDGIRLPLSADDRRVLLRKPTDDPEAYDLYLRAIRSIERETEEDFLAARGLLRRALARDPNFALAYVALATTYSIMAIEGYERPAEACPRSAGTSDAPSTVTRTSPTRTPRPPSRSSTSNGTGPNRNGSGASPFSRGEAGSSPTC